MINPKFPDSEGKSVLADSEFPPQKSESYNFSMSRKEIILFILGSLLFSVFMCLTVFWVLGFFLDLHSATPSVEGFGEIYQ